MTRSYAIAYLQDVAFGDDIARYLERIDETLAPYGGRFLVHGGHLAPVEGDWDGDVIIIEFPDADAAQQWYDSPAYQAILPLRTGSSRGIAALLRGVSPGHRATDKLAELLRAGAGS